MGICMFVAVNGGAFYGCAIGAVLINMPGTPTRKGGRTRARTRGLKFLWAGGGGGASNWIEWKAYERALFVDPLPDEADDFVRSSPPGRKFPPYPPSSKRFGGQSINK